MHIAIDARSMSHPQPGGFKTYTTNLIRALLVEDRQATYTIYLDRPMNGVMLPANANASLRIIEVPAPWIGMPFREQISIPLHIRSTHPDLVHFPCATGSLYPRIPLVVTIHDAIEFLELHQAGRSPRENARRFLMSLYNRQIQRLVARRAQAIITVSDYSKRDIMRVLAVPDRQIRVVPNAPADLYRPIHDPTTIRQQLAQYHLPPAFILALVSASPRKNATGLLRIYARLPVTIREKYPLVIVWTHALLQTSITEETNRLGLANCVRFLSHVPDKDLVLLYNAATLFVFTSLYEGFGLPVLEAMACGTPVLASNLTSIPEVAGTAACLADPRDEPAFSQALADLLGTPDIRANLSESGLHRARQFSWQHTARMTLEVYRETVAAIHSNGIAQ
ncbi:MAG: glycosyltransferase family 1 protein [Chloroflexi bacterium]|nr:glycosyltransferase family 1 protein [Chloroflexota bacterium]